MKKNLLVALIAVVTLLGATISVLRYENHNLAAQLRVRNAELAEAKSNLLDARYKLGYIEQRKSAVQVTAYALTPDFGDNPIFSNGGEAKKAFAVPTPHLPANRTLNVALSPVVEHRLKAKLNDTIVLVSKRGHKVLARFVDRTAQSETRPVVDVLFSDAHQARIWGRQNYYAVNISSSDSPFIR
jgi:hypothetical protein